MTLIQFSLSHYQKKVTVLTHKLHMASIPSPFVSNATQVTFLRSNNRRTDRVINFDAVIQFSSITFSCQQFRMHRDIRVLEDGLAFRAADVAKCRFLFYSTETRDFASE